MMVDGREITVSRGLRAVVYLDSLEVKTSNDRDVYAKWSARARLATLIGRPIGPIEAYRITKVGHAGTAKQWRARNAKIERYVRRAVPTPWRRAVRAEMRELLHDLRYWRFPRRLTLRERAAAAWKAWNTRYDEAL